MDKEYTLTKEDITIIWLALRCYYEVYGNGCFEVEQVKKLIKIFNE